MDTTPQFGIFPSPQADLLEDIAAVTRLADDRTPSEAVDALEEAIEVI